MSQASQKIAQQYVDGGVLPAQLSGQDAVSKKYVEDQLLLRDETISAAASAASAAQSTIDIHKADSNIHVSQSEKATYNEHVANSDIHVTSIKKAEWDSKAPGSTQTDLTSHIGDSVVHVTAAEHIKLDGIQVGAEVNQNAFAKVNDVNAGAKSDTLFIVGGIGITISTDPATKKVTITATGQATPGAHASTHITGGSDVIPNAVTGGASGLMSGADAQFVRVDGETKTGAQSKANIAKTEAITDASNKLNTHSADGAAHGIGDKSTLLTSNKNTIVAALNELFTNANSLKTDWAGVVGSPLLNTDTSAQLKSKTQDIKDELATSLTNKGQPSNGSETLTALVSKVPNISTGKKYAFGSIGSLNTKEERSVDCGFIPSVFMFSGKVDGVESRGAAVIYKPQGGGSERGDSGGYFSIASIKMQQVMTFRNNSQTYMRSIIWEAWE